MPMARTGRAINHDFENLMDNVSECETRTAETAAQHGRGRREPSGGFSAARATLLSTVALLFSGDSLYEPVLKETSLRAHPPPLVTMYRAGFHDLFAVPMTISNDGAQRG